MVSIVDDLILPGLVNVSCTFLTDLFRSFGKRPWDKTISKDVNDFIDIFIDSEIDSGSFVKFLQRPETTLNFKEYIKYIVYRTTYKNRLEKTNIILKLSREDFIKEIANNAVDFIKLDVGKQISISLVTSYFDKLLYIIESKLVSKLSEDSFVILYFLNHSLIEMEERILQSLKMPIKLQNDNYENTRKDYIKIIRNRNKRSHVYGIDELDLYSFYVFPTFEIFEKDKKKRPRKPISWTNIFNESNVVSIIGGPGFGKSLFLKNLINKHEDLSIFESDKLLPIYCDLKQYKIFSQKHSSYSLEAYLVDSIINYTGMDNKIINRDFLYYFLSSGRCLLMFDALDEVEKEDREEINNLITSFFEASNKHNKVCITSRALGFHSKTRVTFQVSQVSIEQIKEYLEKMCGLGLFDESNIADFISQCIILIDNQFLTSLLQVSLLVNIFKAEKELPMNKIDLYEKCIEYISKKREKDQKKTNFDFKLMSSILDNNTSFEKLAWLARPNNIEINENRIKPLLTTLYRRSYLTENETINAIDEFLNFCSQRTELYVPASKDGDYKFYHRSFFEFFYSKCIIKEYSDNLSLLKELLKFDIDSEMFELTTLIIKLHHYDRYYDFLDLILEVLKGNTVEKFNQEDFLKCCIMIYASDEVYCLNELLKKIMESNKILVKIDQAGSSQFIFNCLMLADNKGILEKREFFELYKNELVSAQMLYLILDKVFTSSHLFKGFYYPSNLFIHLRYIIGTEKIYMIIAEEYDLQTIEQLFFNRIKIHDTEDEKLIRRFVKKEYSKIVKSSLVQS
ncbi:NACHT domain-containing NTPase [Paenibacillus lentus]|uniref:NACHT domain-containing protein n=1 Tax=Paenibacillus lentus TaxID=1338368 RepID=UPI00364D6020